MFGLMFPSLNLLVSRRDKPKTGAYKIFQQSTPLSRHSYSLLTRRDPIVFIISSFLPHSEKDFLHAVVVVGIDKESVYINDSLLEESSPFKMARSAFQAAWQWYNYSMISVVPSQEK